MVASVIKTSSVQRYVDFKVSRVWKYWPFFLLVGIIVIGGCLRLYRLGVDSIWIDEYTSVYYATQQGISSMLTAMGGGSVHPPLYFLLLHFWLQLGDTDFQLRLPSALFGILSIAALYFMTAEMFDRRVGLLSALLLALSPMHLRHAQEARMYTLLVFATLSSSYFLWTAWQKNKAVAWAAYVVAAAISSYTHYLAIPLLAVQNVFVVLSLFTDKAKRRRRTLRWLIAQIVVLLFFFPWLLTFWDQTQTAITAETSLWIAKLYGHPTLYDLLRTSGHFSFGYETSYFSSRWFRFACLAVLASVFGLGALDRRNSFPFLSLPRTRAVLFTLTSLVVPIIALWLFSQIKPLFIPRYTMVYSPFFYILLARGLCTIHPRRAQAIVALVVISIFGYYAVQYHTHARTVPWREIANYVAEGWQAEDIVLLADHRHGWLFSYYVRTNIPAEQIRWPEKGRVLPPDGVNTWLNDSTTGHDRVWFIRRQRPSRLERDPSGIQAYLDSQFSLIRQHSFEQKIGQEFDVILYTRITAQSVLDRSEQNTLNYDIPSSPPAGVSPGYPLALRSKSGTRPRRAADLAHCERREHYNVVKLLSFESLAQTYFARRWQRFIIGWADRFVSLFFSRQRPGASEEEITVQAVDQFDEGFGWIHAYAPGFCAENAPFCLLCP